MLQREEQLVVENAGQIVFKSAIRLVACMPIDKLHLALHRRMIWFDAFDDSSHGINIVRLLWSRFMDRQSCPQHTWHEQTPLVMENHRVSGFGGSRVIPEVENRYRASLGLAVAAGDFGRYMQC